MESHPIMNNRLLHYLGHGDIAAKRNVLEFKGKKVIFEDGTEEEVDLIIAATGYKRTFPFLSEDLLDKGTGKEIDPYLQIFSRKFDKLFFVGGIEVSSAIFGLLSLQGELIAAYLKAGEKNNDSFKNFLENKKSRNINLKGKNKYIDSLRHQRYVDKKLYENLLLNHIQMFSK